MDLNDKRAAAKALTPYRDRAKDKVRMWFYKAIAVGFVILVIVVLSLTNEPPK